MDKKYQVHFILCEDIRSEMNGKITLAGVFPGALVVLVRNEPGTVLPKGLIALLPHLAFAFFVRGPEGEIAVSMSISGPDNKKFFETPIGQTKIKSEHTTTVALRASGFGVPGIGKYTVRLSLGEEVQDLSFEVQAGPNFVVPQSDSAPKKAKKKKKRTVVKEAVAS